MLCNWVFGYANISIIVVSNKFVVRQNRGSGTPLSQENTPPIRNSFARPVQRANLNRSDRFVYAYATLALINQRLKDEKLEFDKLTLCISNRTRITYFRAQDGLLEKNETKFHNLQYHRAIARCLHLK